MSSLQPGKILTQQLVLGNGERTRQSEVTGKCIIYYPDEDNT